MFTNFPLFPQQASVQAGQVDAIYIFMVAVTTFFSLLIAGLIVVFAIKLPASARGRDRRGDSRLARARAALDGDPVRHRDGDVRLGHQGLLRPVSRAERRDGGLHRRQAVDVEGPAHDRAAGDQRAARPDRPAGQADRRVGGHHPQLLHPGVPGEGRRHSRALQLALVPPDRRRRASRHPGGDDQLHQHRGLGARSRTRSGPATSTSCWSAPSGSTTPASETRCCRGSPPPAACWSWTRPTASPTGATTSGPTTAGSARCSTTCPRASPCWRPRPPPTRG